MKICYIHRFQWEEWVSEEGGGRRWQEEDWGQTNRIFLGQQVNQAVKEEAETGTGSASRGIVQMNWELSKISKRNSLVKNELWKK